jgi:hypothetical protein
VEEEKAGVSVPALSQQGESQGVSLVRPGSSRFIVACGYLVVKSRKRQKGGFLMEWEGQTDGVHTPDNPYCSDLDCWCHTSVEYHDLATELYVTDEDVEQAYSFYGLSRS